MIGVGGGRGWQFGATGEIADSRAFESIIDHVAAGVDRDIVGKDGVERAAGGAAEGALEDRGAHSFKHSLYLTDSRVVSIRNNSIYQDYLF